MQIFCQSKVEWKTARVAAVDPTSSHFSRLAYENLNLGMQNGSWTQDETRETLDIKR